MHFDSSSTTVPAMGTRWSLVTTPLGSPTARRLLENLDAELVSMYPEHPYPPPFGDEEASGVGSVLVVYDGRKATGCGAVRLIDDTTAEILRMYVLPADRGRGIGKLLLESLEAEAVGLGASKVIIETGNRQTNAIDLYQSHGYQRTKTWLRHPNPHSIFMTRLLD